MFWKGECIREMREREESVCTCLRERQQKIGREKDKKREQECV